MPAGLVGLFERKGGYTEIRGGEMAGNVGGASLGFMASEGCSLIRRWSPVFVPQHLTGPQLLARTVAVAGNEAHLHVFLSCAHL